MYETEEAVSHRSLHDSSSVLHPVLEGYAGQQPPVQSTHTHTHAHTCCPLTSLPLHLSRQTHCPCPFHHHQPFLPTLRTRRRPFRRLCRSSGACLPPWRARSRGYPTPCVHPRETRLHCDRNPFCKRPKLWRVFLYLPPLCVPASAVGNTKHPTQSRAASREAAIKKIRGHAMDWSESCVYVSYFAIHGYSDESCGPTGCSGLEVAVTWASVYEESKLPLFHLYRPDKGRRGRQRERGAHHAFFTCMQRMFSCHGR